MRKLTVLLFALIGMAALGALWQWWCSRREALRFTAPGTLVDVGGRRLHLNCTGSGSPTVILEASGFGNASSYHQVLPEIAKRTQVCAYDRAGMGFSDPALVLGVRWVGGRPGRAPRPRGRATSYLLVAGSAGGLIAQRFALHHPDEVSGLVLLDAPSPETLARVPNVFDNFARAACVGRWAARVGLVRLLDPFGLRKGTGEAAARSLALTYKTTAWDAVCGMTRSFRSEANRPEGERRLPRDLPLRVLSHGEPRGLLLPGQEAEAQRLEPLWQELEQALAQKSAKGSYRSVPGSGHLIASEQPLAVVNAVFELLDASRAR